MPRSPGHGLNEPSVGWYTSPTTTSGVTQTDPARQAFEEASRTFKTNLTSDPRKRQSIDNFSSIEDVHHAVDAARNHYDTLQKNDKVRKWVVRFSAQVQLYGKVLDVLAQHHPEYIALAWGTLKFFFTTALNHDGMICALAKGLSQIGNLLPRVDLANFLYPNEHIRKAVAELYSYIIRFLLRAYDWYNENKLQHVLHAITRPAEIRCLDLLTEIERCSNAIRHFATSSAQAEQRDMHIQQYDMAVVQRSAFHEQGALLERQMAHIELLTKRFGSIEDKLTSLSSVTIDTNQRVSDLQLSNIIQAIASPNSLDPLKSLHYLTFMTHRCRPRGKLSNVTPFWNSPKLAAWTNSNDSALVVVKGGYAFRESFKQFQVNTIQLLRDECIPTLWVLKSQELNGPNGFSGIDILKNLVSQALKLNTKFHEERLMSLNCSRVQSASTESEWVEILGAVLCGIPLVYIVIDATVLGDAFRHPTQEFQLPRTFGQLFQVLRSRAQGTIVKVLLIGDRSLDVDVASNTDFQTFAISVRSQISSKSTGLERFKNSRMNTLHRSHVRGSAKIDSH
ncbi:MAG: hypothetical protein M1831_006774 [Alyxoria varia]|nr:MAG: hypothetical protein M1831_006774 [Alyxoria varia]